VFESIPADDASARLRVAAVPPLVVFVLALLYLTVYPLLARVPVALFWIVVLILLAGSVLGAIAIVRAVRRERPRGRALGWLAAAIAIELVCARICLGLILPWL
jgi:uncharacterized membrane protein YecN with MAPEG domain